MSFGGGLCEGFVKNYENGGKSAILAEEGFFVDSGKYPERNGDGIARKLDGGVGYGFIFEREDDYMAPVTAHFGYNNVEQYGGDPEDPAALIGGCTFEDRSKIVYIDELDEEDNVNVRLDKVAKYHNGEAIIPEVECRYPGPQVHHRSGMLRFTRRRTA